VTYNTSYNIDNPKLGALIGGSDGHTRRIGDTITVYSRDSIIDAIKNCDTMVMISRTNLITDISEFIKMVYSMIKAHAVSSR